MEKAKKLAAKHAQKLRFAVVGGANTALDFGLLFLFVALGLDKIPANYLSTGIAFISSFFLNKSYTFKSKGGNIKKQFAYFIGITIFGLWVIQPIVISLVALVLEPTDLASPIVLFIAKLIATVASLIWNYLFYSRLVFKDAK
jgi:putative flippase GtrA